MANAVSIPPEIWALIAQHLPKSSLIPLRSINKLFYALALDEMYNEFVMNQINGRFIQKLEGLKDAGHAKRVRRLYLDPPCLHELATYEKLHEHHPAEHIDPNPVTIFATRLLRKFVSRHPEGSQPEEKAASSTEITDDLLAVIPTLDNVTQFTLSWNSAEGFDAPYLTLAWYTLPSNLQELHLDVHPRFVASLLPHDVNFPQLTTLKFSLCITEADETPTLTSQTIDNMAKFIGKFKHSLKALYIGSPQKRNLGEVYALLPRFDNLQEFEICPHTFASPSNLLSFLQMHSEVLRSITYASDPNPAFQDGLSQLDMTALEKLVMRLNYVPYPRAWWTAPSSFFNSVSSTLRVLLIEAAVTVAELIQLLDAFPAPVAIEEFSVSIHNLSIEILVIMAKRLPKLKSLDLRIHDVIAKGGFPITPGEFFPENTMSTNLHPRQTTPEAFIQWAKDDLPPLAWGLQDILIKRRSCCGDLILWGIMRLCAECIPTIKSFAKRGSTRIPNPPNVKPPGKSIRCSGTVCAFGGGGSAKEPRDYTP
ncbi:hypothetical protein D9611_006568 [Ephemerocybe angulata]|uniref:F-box domain-containing protein n=1 Tax=Ephemerocybe angulata TaxID=980116 RepID=A0A8H5C7G9_9AGAR|nr:hypothetical protein D9611_006568 [Tulosesus angulatus]